jgi:rubrerythrin
VDLGISALLSAASAQEVLERAWGMELALGEYYGVLAARSSDPDLAALFECLAGFEERHRRTLTEIWKRLGNGEVEAFESRARRAVAPGTLEGGISAQDYLGQLGEPASMSAALELAMAVEAQAMDLYLRRSKVEPGVEPGAEPDADLRRTLVLLAEEEKAHLKVLGSFVDSRKGF